MSDHEPSYYEIALTNRQVMVAFVILLSCLLGTFFAGVWVGRSEAEPSSAPAAERQAGNDSGVEELDFFAGGDLGESDEEEAAPAPPVPLPDPAAERAERVARRVEETVPPPPAVDGAVGDDDLDRGEGPAAERPETSRPAGPTTAPPAADAPPAAEGGPVVQVFSSRDRDQAERVVDRLRDGGERPHLSPVEVDGQTMYRVRLGPFPDREEAARVAERVRRGFGLDTWITQ